MKRCYTDADRPDRELTMKQIDISELPTQTDDEIRHGETYAVTRDGEVVGYFLPRKREDPEKLQEALEALDRTIQDALRNGYTSEQLAEDLDLSKPARHDV
jgi:hypothetical protein